MNRTLTLLARASLLPVLALAIAVSPAKAEIPRSPAGVAAGLPNLLGVAGHVSWMRPNQVGGQTVYVVASGDTVSGIAARYGVSVGDLVQLNRVPDGNLIRIGQRLLIPNGYHPAPVRQLVATTAQRFGVDPALAVAIAWQESGFNQGVTSLTGAVGVMQVEPYTATVIERLLGRTVDLSNVYDNVLAGVYWLSYLLRSYGGDERSAVAAYYEGAKNLAQYGYVADTGQYVTDVMALRAYFAPTAGYDILPTGIDDAYRSTATGGSTATVTFDVLNVRGGPSLSAPILAVTYGGTTLSVLAQSQGWLQVRLPSGTVGWVAASAVSAQTTRAPVTHPAPRPSRAWPHGQPALSLYSGLRVHVTPSLAGTLVTALARGQRVVIVARTSGWMRIAVTPTIYGWVLARLLAPVRASTSPSSRGVASSKARPSPQSSSGGTSGGKKAAAHPSGTAIAASRLPTALIPRAINVHAWPSLSAPIPTSTDGSPVEVLHIGAGWMQVRLANGISGWVLARLVTRVIPPKVKAKPRPSAQSVRVPPDVRIHSAPALTAPVIAATLPGMRVTVVRRKSGFALIRGPHGIRGWIVAQFVQQ